jgi:hypothetical protein
MTTPDYVLEQAARRDALLRINPHIYYDEEDRYDMASAVIPTGRWITLELAVRSFGWEKVERSPDLQRMLVQVPRAACEYINDTVLRMAGHQQ